MKIKILFCCLVFIMAAFVENACGSTCVWTNATGDNSWNTANNWNIGVILPSHAVPGSGDDAVLNTALLSNYTVNLAGNVQCKSITCNATILAGGVNVNTNGYTLTIGNLNVGTASLLSATVLSFLGNGAITISSGVTLGQATALAIGSLVGILNFGSSTDATTNVTIQPSATVALNGPSGAVTLLSTGTLLGLLNGPSIINNYGSLTMTTATANFNGLGSQLVNNIGGTVTSTGSTFNLSYDLAGIVNFGTFNVSGTTGTTTNFNYLAGSNYIYNYGAYNAGVSTAVCNFNLNGGASALLTANLNLIVAGITIILLPGTGPSINNATTTVSGTAYNGTFNLGSVSAIYPTSATSLVSNNSPNCVFTLLSDQNGSGTIGRAASGATISGQYNVQRYMTGNSSLTYRGYRLLSSPVNITSATSSASGTNYISMNTLNKTYTISGTSYYGAFTGGPNGTTAGFSVANPNPTIYFYQEPLATSNSTFVSGKNQGVTSITASQVTLSNGNTYSIPVGNAYLLYFIGSTKAPRVSGTTSLVPDNACITNVGYINQQNINVNLWYSTTGALNLSRGSTTTFVGFNMVGNPYPSSLDLKLVYSDNAASIGTAFYEFNDALQRYVIFNGSSGSTSGSGASQYVASGQGFYVVASSTSSKLTFNENEKPAVATPPGTIFLAQHKGLNIGSASLATNSAPTTPLTGLHLKLSADSLTFNECGIYYSSAWSDDYDYNDALDIGGFSQKVSLSALTADGVRVGIDELGSYANGKNVKLYVQGVTDGTYNMQLEDMLNIDTANYHMYLLDHFTKDSVDIASKKSYAFTITNADTTTFGSARFELAIERKAKPPYQLLSFTAQKVTGGVLLSWKTANEGNLTGFNVEKAGIAGSGYSSVDKVQSDGGGSYTYLDRKPVLGTNTYRLAQSDANSNITYSNALNVTYDPATAPGVLSVYPNPAKTDISVLFNTTSNSASQQSYQANIYNSTGLLIMKKSVNSNSWSEDVSPLRPGAYIIEVRAENGSLIGNTKFTKEQ